MDEGNRAEDEAAHAAAAGADDGARPSPDALMRFSEAVRGWFLDAFPAGATPVQEQAWEAVEDGENALVIAPTGSGKTLAAFLFALDALMREKARPASARPPRGVRVLYVSPLKALGADSMWRVRGQAAAQAGFGLR
ncbi:DEAD/DEAH box helicase [Gordonibacter pamelaeae]|uniref:Lhr-like helicases n=1 Tax=Gordonibacter pamelaeae 7-10-1-b TaxID=657308 RepID=D6E9J6_9ACTN|nr:DEAD/DEAH box helicase [Gordonibacter pamelaeae]CBL04393.1 Lhr-like helicases [Gordonibacter pamelaeae 7-10-1-b]